MFERVRAYFTKQEFNSFTIANMRQLDHLSIPGIKVTRPNAPNFIRWDVVRTLEGNLQCRRWLI